MIETMINIDIDPVYGQSPLLQFYKLFRERDKLKDKCARDDWDYYTNSLWHYLNELEGRRNDDSTWWN